MVKQMIKSDLGQIFGTAEAWFLHRPIDFHFAFPRDDVIRRKIRRKDRLVSDGSSRSDQDRRVLRLLAELHESGSHSCFATKPLLQNSFEERKERWKTCARYSKLLNLFQNPLYFKKIKATFKILRKSFSFFSL